VRAASARGRDPHRTRRDPEIGKGQTPKQPLSADEEPVDPENVPGGSSGGAGAANAALMGPSKSAPKGGCSIRFPAALEGVTGLSRRSGINHPNAGQFGGGPASRFRPGPHDAHRRWDAALAAQGDLWIRSELNLLAARGGAPTWSGGPRGECRGSRAAAPAPTSSSSRTARGCARHKRRRSAAARAARGPRLV